jgi:UDP-N-acetylglucosamine:LPS N-acetylglucosamine transferase
LQKCIHFPRSIHLLIVLYGPEPQRSLLEGIIVEELKTYTGTAVLVRGIFDNTVIKSFSQVSIVNNASAAELNRLMCDAEIVISRSGYTSIMDILKLGKKSILIPTPGQAEQEYLAWYLHKKHLAYSIEQEKFSLNTALENSRNFMTEHISLSMDEYKTVLNEFVGLLKGPALNHRE